MIPMARIRDSDGSYPLTFAIGISHAPPFAIEFPDLLHPSLFREKAVGV